MTRCLTILICCTTISFLFAADEPRRMTFDRVGDMRPQFASEIKNDLLTNEQQLVLGLVVLNRRQSVFRNGEYSYYLRELLKVTGFDAGGAVEILAKYKDNPEKYLAFLEEIKLSLVKKNE